MLIDSHCHLNYEGLSEQIPDIITRANEANVSHMVCICSRLSEFDAVRECAETYNNVFCSVGVHPHDCANEPLTDPLRIIKLAEHPKVIGIGETGLDFHYNHSPRSIQEKNFKSHIEASRATKLPLIVHTRSADTETINILTRENKIGDFPGVIHCFSTGIDVAMCALELGFYISLSGIITFKNADDLRKIVKNIPLNRVLIETDSPFLAPVPHRGQLNEPALIVHTAEKLSEIFGISFEEIAKITTENFFNLFTKAKIL